MPRQIPEPELQAIVQAVRNTPEGVSAEAIQRRLPMECSRRALQRRLAVLVERGLLVRDGQAKATRYRFAAESGPSGDSVQPTALSDYGIPLTAEGAAISKAVRRPVQRRTPVGYQRNFLTDYRPNVSHYVPEAVRREFHALGGSPDQKQPAGTYARKIYERLLIDLSWNSSRLEGNTYSLLETVRLLELGEAAQGKEAFETQMILNHKAAIQLLVDQAEHIGFNGYTVRNLHAVLAENLIGNSRAWGSLRTVAVEIGGSVYHPLENPQLIEECFREVLDKAAAIDDPFEQALFALVQLPYLQPFLDVNKRVSRLAANLSLIRLNLCPLSFVDLPPRAYIDGLLGVYELNRIELLRDVFRWAYQRSCARYSAMRQPLASPDPFRQRHRTAINDAIRAVVGGRMDKQAANAHVGERAAAELQEQERERYIEIVETELLNLHEGNIARAQLSPEQFKAWQAAWTN